MSSQLILQPNPTSGVDTKLVFNNLATIANYGTATIAPLGVSFDNKEPPITRALFRFDLTSIPASATINAATFHLFNAGESIIGDQEQFVFHAYRLTQSDWTELGTSWVKYDGTNSWSTPGGDFTTTDGDLCAPADEISDLEFTNLAALAADAIVHRAGLLHLIVLGPEDQELVNYLNVYLSDYSGDASKRPMLTVDYTSRPLTAGDLSGGMQQLAGNLGG